MPHINRIRVNNVKYNFGTQFYDDFILRFDGKNALYDLANGGGKSVLMLLLFQNLIPNCTLDEKQPIEKLFRTDQGSKTIHSLIEWKLDERFIHDQYKYMLTGFCARKAREELRETAAIEYFNYVIFYRGYNDNDLVNLPLSDGKERVTYTGLKTYLKELGRRDMGLEIHIFDRKGEYQRFISQYGLYESHWEILRGINKTEGHVRTYFENRYRTTRKVIEDLFIEEIIQRAFLQEGHSEADMADTLIQIKDKLTELAKRRKEMDYYDRQAEILESFSGRAGLLKKVYEEKEALERDMVKTYHTIGEIHRMKEKELAVFEKEKAYAGKHIQEISRKLDTLKVQENQEYLSRLETDTEVYAKTLEELKEMYRKQQEKLNFLESQKDYREYLEIQSQWESLRIFMSEGGKAGEEIFQELQMLAKLRWTMDQKEKKLLGQQVWEAEKAYGELAVLKDETEKQERQLFGESHVLESQISETQTEEENFEEGLNRLCQQMPVLVFETIGNDLREKRQQQAALAFKMEEYMEKKQSQAEKAEQLLKSVEERQDRDDCLKEEEKDLTVFLENYSKEQERIGQLLKVYHASDTEDLLARMKGQLHKVILDSELKRQEMAEMEERLTNLRQGSSVVPGPETKAVIEYIRRCHGLKCIFGGDYLKDVDVSDRQILLERIPFLPSAVILESGMQKLKEDPVLREKDFGDCFVPVLPLRQVLEQKAVLKDEEILFLSKNQAFYTEASVRESACLALEKAVKEGRILLRRLFDREETIEKDRQYMAAFEVNYRQYYRERFARKAALGNEMEENRKRLKEEREMAAALQADNFRLEKLLAELESQKADLDEIVEVLDKMNQFEAQRRVAHQKKIQLEGQLAQKKEAQQAAAKKFQEITAEMAFQTDQKKNFRNRMVDLETSWNENYVFYYREDADLAPEFLDISREAAEARFIGLKEAYEREHSNLEDKKRLLESYGQMMEKLLRMIKKRGTDLSLLEQMASEHRLQLTDAAESEEMTAQLEALEKNIRHREEILFQYQADKNKLYGSVSQGVKTIEETYGTFQQVVIPLGDFQSYAQQQRQALESMRDKLAEAENGIQSGLKDLRAFEDVKRDLERSIQNDHIPLNLTKETYGPEVDIRKKHREIHEKEMRLRTEIQRKRDGFFRDREKAAESLRLLTAVELAEAIQKEVGIPGTSEAAAFLIQQLAETVSIIRLEKERIEQTIQDMIQIKANFEKQCLQRCLTIRAELERFPAYSKIFLDGKQVPMVMLRIPYVKEEIYHQRMSEYIEGVVTQADTYEAEEERAAYIRKQLSWKRLFSAIVTDMNSIRLSLYKRERVKEQSRYLRYEEAVGSTGQSQGIYIQFLIGVINYISMVYSGGSDGADLQKVIFIDNPFGAAKDVYIWQPIFELLRTNRVQLIVPTRGATPAITGKFDVNYVLGQKMVDKMQQTVVVDYSSNVDVANLEYEKLEFEQEVFDFVL